VVASLIIIEVLLRVIDPLGLSYFPEMSRYILDRIPDAELKYRHRPNFESTYQGVRLRFNEAGLRDDPIQPKSPSEYRILLLGDSQTMGWGVERDYIWAVRLQRILSQKLKRPIRVINSGVASYETRQEYRYLMRNGYAFEPDLVLLMFMDNDLEINDNPYDPWSEHSLKGKSASMQMKALMRRLRLFQFYFFWNQMTPSLRNQRYEPQQVGIPYKFDEALREQTGWREAMAALGKIRQSAQERGIKFAVVHFDWTSFPYSRELDRAVCAAVSPFPVAYAADWFSGKDVRPYFVSKVDSHPNAEGHRILAEGIAEFILRQDWIPSSANQPGRK
jgi:lysophospholipase L1-like esterase